MHTVFVYGTLKKGFEFHYHLKGSIYLGQARTKESYSLYLDDYPYVNLSQKIYPILGEVYKVSDSVFSDLDQVEDYPELYSRKQIPILLEKGEELFAWIYYKNSSVGTLLENGVF